MDIVFIAIVSGLASLATFYSGFGLGTLLMPAMALYFPIDVAIALTAVVHFMTNLFKLSLTYKHIDRTVAIQFGIPALLFAAAGAMLLSFVGEGPPLVIGDVFGTTLITTPVKVLISLLILLFVLVDTLPSFQRLSFGKDKIMLGGVLSGFFGGLAGFQGALRSMFLVRFGLDKESYIGTGVVIACAIDLSRIGTYSSTISWNSMGEYLPMLLAAVCAGWLGAFLGNRLLKKVTLVAVQRIVAVCLIVFTLCLGTGLI